MFEIRFVDAWDLGIPSYYVIFKDGKMWCPFSFRNEFEAIDEIASVDQAAADELTKVYATVM